MKEKEKEIEKGRQRDNKRRLRASAAVLEPRLISPITPYSAATHTILPPHATCSTDADLPLPPALLPARATTHPQPVLLGATMERLIRSNPRHSRLFSPARASTLSRRALASLRRLYTTSVDEVCLTRGSVYRIYYRFPRLALSLSLSLSLSPPLIHPLDGLSRLSFSVLLVPRTSSMVHSR